MSFKRIFYWGWLAFRRQKGISIAAVFIFTLTLFSLTSLIVFQETARFLTEALEKRIDLSIYFKEEAPQEKILQLKEILSQLPEVESVQVVSREEAYSQFVERHKDNEVIMESLKELGINPFLPALNVQTVEANQYARLTNSLQNSQFKDIIAKIDFYNRKPVIEKLNSINANINFLATIVIILFAIGAVAIVFNQIRVSIENAREEIEIMRLVGASNLFIRGPFIVQGIIAGLFAVVIASVLFGVGLYFLSPRIAILLPGLDLFGYFVLNIDKIILVQLLAVIVLGVFSALVATRTYLKI